MLNPTQVAEWGDFDNDGWVDLFIGNNDGSLDLATGSSSLQQEIGLGAATGIRAIEVKWPASGTVQEFKSVSMVAFLKIREGAAAPERLERRAFKISTEPGPEAPSAHTLHRH